MFSPAMLLNCGAARDAGVCAVAGIGRVPCMSDVATLAGKTPCWAAMALVVAHMLAVPHDTPTGTIVVIAQSQRMRLT